MGGCGSSRAIHNEGPIPVAVLGLPGVGKTSFVECLANEYNPRDPPFPTGGLIQRQVTIHGCAFLMYDVCGNLYLSDDWATVLAKVAAVVLIFSPVVLERGAAYVTDIYNKFGPVIVERALPTLVLVNQWDGNTDVSHLEQLNSELADKVPLKFTKIAHLESQVPKVFAWIEEQLCKKEGG
jgi:GTPase SAR1 family protein